MRRVAAVLAVVLLSACTPTPPPKPVLPPVKPWVVFTPVCTRRDGVTAGWNTSLRIAGQYRIKLFNGPYPPIVDYTWPRRAQWTPGGDPNQAYVLTTVVPWVLEYRRDEGQPWVEVSDRINTRPTTTCTI